MKAGNAMIQELSLNAKAWLIIVEQEPILCIIVNSVLQKNLRIRNGVYEIDTAFQV